MGKILALLERVIIIVLIIFMSFTVIVSTIELGVVLSTELLKPPKYLLNIEELLEIFGFFMMVLIGLELLEIIKTYVKETVLHVEICFLVAMIAIARKVIILDIKSVTPLSLLGIAAIIVALAIGFYSIKMTYKKDSLTTRQ